MFLRQCFIKIVMLILLVLIIAHPSHARQECNTSVLTKTNNKPCNITEFWLQNNEDIFEKVSPFTDYQDTLIIGFTGILGQRRMLLSRLDPTDVYYDPFFSILATVSLELTAAAVPTAIEDYCQQQKRFHFTFVIFYLQGSCQNSDSVDIIRMIQSGIDVIFGSPCSSNGAFLSTNYLTYLNIPYFLTSGSVTKGYMYKTLVRMGPNFGLAAASLIKLCQQYGWSVVSILSFDQRLCWDVVQIKDAFFHHPDMTLVQFAVTSPRISEDNLRQKLRDAKAVSRVIFLCYYTTLLQRIMKLALEEGMVTGEFVFIKIHRITSTGLYQPWGSTEGLAQSSIDAMKQPYKNLKILSIPGIDAKYEPLKKEIKNRAVGHPWYFSYVADWDYAGSDYAPYIYDTVWMYLQILHEIVDTGLNIRNGSLFFQKSRNRSFEGKSGNLDMNDEAERLPKYWLFQLKPGKNQMSHFASFDWTQGSEMEFSEHEEAYWATTDGKPPPNEPRCGFKNEKCFTLETLLPISLAFLPIAAVLIYFFVMRPRILRKRAREKTWRILNEEMVPIDKNAAELARFVSTLGSKHQKVKKARQRSRMASEEKRAKEKTALRVERLAVESSLPGVTENYSTESSSLRGSGTDSNSSDSNVIGSSSKDNNISSRNTVKDGVSSEITTIRSFKDGHSSESAILRRSTKSSMESTPGKSLTSTSDTATVSSGKSFTDTCNVMMHKLRELSVDADQFFAEVVFCKETVCAIKTITKTTCNLTASEGIKLTQVRQLSHTNVNQFIGVCIANPYMYVLTEYCSRGCLQDVIENESLKLDWVFKCSLIFDLVNGLLYIHESPLKSHGSLKSSKCLVNNQWVLKIQGAGLKFLSFVNVVETEREEYQIYRDRLWTAPELLHTDIDSKDLLSGTQSGDIYSVAIILQEIVFREAPYFMENISPKEIVEKVMADLYPPFRPKLPPIKGKLEIGPEIVGIMEECWRESAASRPSAQTLKHWIAELFNKSGNLQNEKFTDKRVFQLERYGNTLEVAVTERTEQLKRQRHKSIRLLSSTVPVKIAKMLENGIEVEPEVFNNVTVFFSYIDNIKKIHSQSTPLQMLQLLNIFYGVYNDVFNQYDVVKLRTIGDDACMVVSGCPVRSSQNHALIIANMSLKLRTRIDNFQIARLQDASLQMKMGIHSGPCVAGVVGSKRPVYCLFGTIVPIASQIAIHSKVGKIHLSSTACSLLRDTIYADALKLRGQIQVKGIGDCTTYWLDDQKI